MYSSYFSAKFILSKKALISIVFSDRSDGKTFDCKARALEDFEKDKSIAVYMRRYKTEITSKMYENFFEEVVNTEKYKRFRDWEFLGTKRGVQVRKDKNSQWEWIIYFIPLTCASRLKSQISNIEKIHIINYDEFVPLDNKYLPKEVDLILEFWKSIDRDRDTTQLIILGNRITPFNPVFDYFDIQLDISKEKTRLYKDNTIAVQIYSNKEHRESREKSNFKKMIKGTSYEEYDNGGVLNGMEVKLMNRNDATYYCSFKTSKGEGSIWYRDNLLIVSEYLRKDGYVLTDKVYKINREQYTSNFGKFPKILKHYYNTGNMYFESEKVYYIFLDILTKAGSI